MSLTVYLQIVKELEMTRGICRPPGLTSVLDDGADRLAFMHQVERFIDAFQWHGVGDKGRQLDFAFHGVPPALRKWLT